GQQQHADGDEVGKKGGDADELAGGLQQRPRRREPGGGDEARPHQVGGRQSAAAGLEAKAGEGGKDDVGQALEVADHEGKEADVEDLADQLGDDVVFTQQRPEQAGQGDVDADQGRGQEGDIAGDQAKAGIDVAAEGVGEAVDNGKLVHGSPPGGKSF